MENTKRPVDRSAAILLGGLCSLLYFTSYVSRYSLTVSIAALTGQGILDLTQVGLCTMLLFVFYGAGQLLSGWLGDRLPAERLPAVALIGSGICNAVAPFLVGHPALLAALWGVHGLLQSLFWPPIVKVVATHLPQRYYNSTTLAVSVASHAGTIVLYLLSSLCIGFFGDWRLIFGISTAVCIVMCVLWMVGFNYFTHRYINDEPIGVPTTEDGVPTGGLAKAILSSGALLLVIGIIIQGALKEGVTAWLPSYISQVFSLSASSATLQSVAIPIASITCLLVVKQLYRRAVRNEASAASLLFGIGTAAAALIVFVPDPPTLLVVICAALLTASMHSVNLFLIAYLPARFATYGRTSTVSGITNACAYIGCAAYSYGIAGITERFGWSATSISWLALAAIGFVSCLVALPLWRRFVKKQ